MRYLASALLLSPLLLVAGGAAQEKGEVKLDIVKYDGLKDAVTKHRGKVVLVDFWNHL